MSEQPPVPPPNEPPPTKVTVGTGTSILLGILGFVLFWVLGGFLASAVASGGVVGGIVIGAIILAVVVGGYRNATQLGKAKFARAGVGCALAAVVFGGCIAALSNLKF